MELQLSLKKEHYTLGEVVSGYVDIELDSPKLFNEIYVSCYWKLHGGGRTEQHEKYKVVLQTDEAPLPAGKHHLPFQFAMDDYPITWHGDKLSIDWYIIAYADIPLGWDKKVIKKYSLDYSNQSSIPFKPTFSTQTPGAIQIEYELFSKNEQGESQLVRRLPPQQPAEVENVYEGHGNSKPLQFRIRLTLFSILLSLIAIPSLWAPSTFGWICTALWLFFVPKTYFYYRKELDRSRCGPISIKVDHQDFKPGQTIKIKYKVSPTQAVKIKRLVARIEVLEVFFVFSANDDDSSFNRKRIVRHVTQIEEIEVKKEFILSPGKDDENTVLITLPKNLMHAVRTVNNQILPQIAIHIETEHCRDISAAVALNITP